MHLDQVSILGNAHCQKIYQLYQGVVVPYEQDATFYQRIAIRYYDECTSSSLEGGFAQAYL